MEIVTDHERLAHIAREVEAAEVLGTDLETTSLSPLDGEVRIMSLNTGNGVYVIDLFKTGGIGPIKEAFEKTNAIVLGQGLKFDQKWFLNKWEIEFRRLFDTFRASAIIYNGMPGTDRKHNLWEIMKRELGEEPKTQDLGGSDWSGELHAEQYTYAGEDVVVLPRLRDSLKKKLAEKDLNRIALLEFGAVLPEAAIENAGFYLDQEKWVALAKQKEIEAAVLRKELISELPSPYKQLSFFGMENTDFLDSPKEVLESFRRLGCKLEDTKEITLSMQAAMFPVIEKFLKYRGLTKAVSAFGPEYLKNVKRDGRIHCDYFPFTGAGRYACSHPNLQQIPRGKEYRICFCAPDGKLLAICDYSNIEMRLVAEIAKDPVLRAIFNSTDKYLGDAHYMTAALVTGKKPQDVKKPERQMAKPVNFGFIYGMGAAKLVLYAMANYGVAMTERQAKEFRDAFFKQYWAVGNWHKKVERESKSGIAKTILGRHRYLDPLQAYNEFKNTPVQGSGADGLKRALAIVYMRLKKAFGKKARMVHMVHDEIVVEHDDEGPEFAKAVRHELETGMMEGMQGILTTVACAAEAGGGKTWADKP